MDAFPLDLALPADKADYYAYDVSLTTPPCYQTVEWYIFKEPITISQDQVIADQLNYCYYII